MITITTMLRLSINGAQYLPYGKVMAHLGLSNHPNQLQRRMQQYPGHFTVFNGEVYISLVLAKGLQRYNRAKATLLALKQGGEL